MQGELYLRHWVSGFLGNSVQSGAHCCILSSRPCLSGLLSRSRKPSWISARRRCARTSVVKMEVSKSQCKQREGSSPSATEIETNVAKRGLTSPLRRNIAQVGLENAIHVVMF